MPDQTLNNMDKTKDKLNEYRERLLEVLEVTGQIKKEDVEKCYVFTTDQIPKPINFNFIDLPYSTTIDTHCKRKFDFIMPAKLEEMKENTNMTIEQAKKIYEALPEMRHSVLAGFTDEELGVDNFPYNPDDIDLLGHYVEGEKKIAQARIALQRIAFICNGNQTPSEWIDLEKIAQSKYYAVAGRQGIDIKKAQHEDVGAIYFKDKDMLAKSIDLHIDIWRDYFEDQELVSFAGIPF